MAAANPHLRPDFHLPSRIYIRPDITRDIGAIISRFGSRVILVTTVNDLDIYGSVIEVKIGRAHV